MKKYFQLLVFFLGIFNVYSAEYNLKMEVLSVPINADCPSLAEGNIFVGDTVNVRLYSSSSTLSIRWRIENSVYRFLSLWYYEISTNDLIINDYSIRGGIDDIRWEHSFRSDEYDSGNISVGYYEVEYIEPIFAGGIAQTLPLTGIKEIKVGNIPPNGARECIEDRVYVFGLPRNSTYNEWIDDYSLEGDEALQENDSDGDGLVNLIEYAFNTNPNSGHQSQYYSSSGSAVGMPTIEKNILTPWLGQLELVFPRRTDPNLNYRVQFSSDLQTWYDMPGTSSVTTIEGWDGWEQVKVAFPTYLYNRHFARVCVEWIEP